MWRLAFLFVLMLACSEPCDTLAEKTCGREGEASRACFEIKRQAARAGDDDQRFCREVMRILNGINDAADTEER